LRMVDEPPLFDWPDSHTITHTRAQGRTYDKHVLDMVEFGVSSVAPLEAFKGVEKKRLGAKPCIVFAGEGWEHDATLQRVRSLFTGASCCALMVVRWMAGREGLGRCMHALITYRI
jgi:hypothetical protein